MAIGFLPNFNPILLQPVLLILLN